MKAPIRVGILGAAKIAPNAMIAPARANPEFALSAVGARDKSRAEAYAKKHDIPNVAEGYADLVARDDVDLVFNALPPGMHLEWSIRALEAGKAVLCEKPFAMSALEARSMTEAAERTGRPLIEAFHYRHHAVLRRAFEIAASGRLGKLNHAEAVFEVPIAYDPNELRWVARLGGGALMDLGCYCVHGLRTITRREPKVVRASCDMQHGVDATTDAELDLGDGLTAHLRTSMVSKGFAARLFLEGDKGSIEVLNFIAPQIGCRFTVTAEGKSETLPTDGAPTYAAQLAHVGDVLLRGATPLAGGADAIANMAAIDAIYAAAGVERPYGLQPDARRPRS
jgi:predicted dehydrogenase